MKKIIISMICILLITAMAVGAFAAGTVTVDLKVSGEKIHRGDSVVITVSVSEFADCKSGSLRVEFDENVFSRSDNAGLLTGTTMAIADGDAVFAYATAQTISGDIYKFTLTAKEDAVFSDSAIAVSLKLKDSDGVTVEERKAASVTIVCSHEYDNSCDTKCNICGADRTITHSWDDGKVTKKPTCTVPGEKTFTCTVCGEKKTEPVKVIEHVYDNDCDTECNNGCGTTREAKHDYSKKWYSNGTSHYHKCSVCGDKTDVTAHTPGPEATEWSDQTCTVCGKVLQEALGHTHKYGSEWIYDEMGHWFECSGCEELKDYSDHRYDNACDTVCNDCGYTRQIQHDYGNNWWFDANGHWQECTVCAEKSQSAPHEPGPEATEASAQTCKVCGYELVPALNHTHEYGENWYWDGTGHWQVCACGTATAKEDHNWGDPVVTKPPTADAEGEATFVCQSCDAEKKEPIPAKEPTEPTEPTQGSTEKPKPKEFPSWILIVAGGILALGLILFFIIGAVIGQKQKGKFSAK